MKKIYKALFLAMGLSIGAQAQTTSYTTVNVQDSISTNTTWACDKQYLLKGYVYVTSGATLTVEPGVIIKGDKNTKGSLIIERGAKLIAKGTLAKPIVFTSNQPAGQRSYGDWGGVILCGKAPTNWTAGSAQVEGGPRSLYGGTDAADNSGSLEYVRIEFPGIAFSPNNEVNGLTLCGVGSGTTINHVQVSYSGDDSYEFFGGNVNTKYMVAFAGWDDDFDTDNGYSGFNQYGIALRDPLAADQSGSKAFESDSYLAGTKTGLAGDTSGVTKAVFSNFTVVGPLVSPSSTAYDPQYTAAAHIRRGSALSILNSVIVGYPAGILIDESAPTFGSTVANIQSNLLQIKNNVIAGMPTVNGLKEGFYVINGARNLTPTTTWADTVTGAPFGTFAGPFSWLTDATNSNWLKPNAQTFVRLQNPFNLSNPDFTPTSTSPIVFNNKNLPAYITTDIFNNGKKYPYNGTKAINTDTSNLFANYNAPDYIPNLNSNKIQDAFFTKPNHIGAVNYTGQASDKWTAGWCNWDPQNTDYNVACTPLAVNKYDADKLYLRIAPNPAAYQAVVGYTLTTATNVTIELYNAFGQKVKTVLDNSKQNAGVLAYKFDVSDLNTGMYIVRVSANNMSQTIKLSIAR